MKIPFLALILQGIPETIAVATLAFVVAKIPIKWKKIVLIGMILAFTSFGLRLFPITFGIHTIFSIGLLFILLIRIGRSNLNTALIASLLSYLAVIISETVCLSLLMPLFGVTSDMILSNVTIRILITFPQVLMMFMIAYTVYRFRNKKK
ncbi:MAG: hypothetical protein APF84_08310 [Gracilibacter sp. BRH_c7a]|nr:MAG: hypothetical protein APF84_08310 [Gracilibacter sp. BRH_c7a]